MVKHANYGYLSNSNNYKITKEIAKKETAVEIKVSLEIDFNLRNRQ